MDSKFLSAAGPNSNSGFVSSGRQHSPGTRRTDGSSIGDAGSGGSDRRPRFDARVPQNGYRWWYIDALSDDGQYGLTIIAFVGGVFSPYYFKARKHGEGNPENHCAINVALYGKYRRWAMTEHAQTSILRSANRFKVSQSSMTWDREELRLTLNERCAPLPFNVIGEVVLTPATLFDEPVLLAKKGEHMWRAVAPEARIHVALTKPGISWAGNAYHDMNWGDEPLEDGFQNWNWLRAKSKQGTRVIYDAVLKDGSRNTFSKTFTDNVSSTKVPALGKLRKGLWRMERQVRSEKTPRLISTLEDTPFYTRNHVELTLDGERCEAIHESVSLTRFVHPITQWMLPYRMPRAG